MRRRRAKKTVYRKATRRIYKQKTGILNKEGRRYLNRLYGSNKEFREEIIYFVRDKKELDLKEILGRRYKTNTLNTTRKDYLARFILSKDNTKDSIEILAKYNGCN